MKKQILLITFLLLWSVSANAQMAIVHVYVSTPAEWETLLTLNLDLNEVPCHRGIHAVTNENDRQRLTAAGFEWEFLTDGSAERIDDVYHTYEELTQKLDSLVVQYPQILIRHQIGTSVEGNPIWAIKISDEPAIEDSTEPEILIIGAIHAREIATTEVVLHMIDDVTTRYNDDPEVTNYVNSLQFWFVPMANPDGHIQVENGQDWWRKNTRDNNQNGNLHEYSTDGVDLNRNFGYMWGYDDRGSSPISSAYDYRGPEAFSEPETAAIRDLCQEHQFSFSLSYHSYGRMLLYGWGYIDQNTPDHPIFVEWAERMRAYNGYQHGNPNNGLIYNTNGDSDDWIYGDDELKPRFFGITPEIGLTFWPPAWKVPILCRENLPSLYVTAEAALLTREDPYHLFPPQQPVALSCQYVLDSLYVSWELNDDPQNPITNLILEAVHGVYPIVDSAYTSDHWILDGFTRSTSPPEGHDSTAFYSGRGVRQTMTTKMPIRVQPDDVLTFWTYYNIYPYNDWGYVEVSADGGNTFESIPGDITTNQYNWKGGNNRGNGITSSSYDGWEQAHFSLTDYVGREIYLRFVFNGNYSLHNDEYVGWYIDDITVINTFRLSEIVWQGSPQQEEVVLPCFLDPTVRYRLCGVDGQGQRSGWSELVLPIGICRGFDIDDDGDFDEEDFNYLLLEWGTNHPQLDYNGDGVVNIEDFQYLSQFIEVND